MFFSLSFVWLCVIVFLVVFNYTVLFFFYSLFLNYIVNNIPSIPVLMPDNNQIGSFKKFCFEDKWRNGAVPAGEKIILCSVCFNIHHADVTW